MDVCSVLFLSCLSHDICVCVHLQMQVPLLECRSIRSGVCRPPYYCAPFVCVPAVIGMLDVWWHNRKPIWNIKWQFLEDFSKMFLKKFWFFCRYYESAFVTPISYQSCRFTTRFLVKKLQCVTCWLLNQCLYGQNGQGKTVSENFVVFNTRFWSRQSDHGKRYFQKLDLLSSPWLFPIVHFTCESVLNDKHLGNYLLYSKVLWMPLSQFLEMFIVNHMFDWNEAWKSRLLCVKRQYCSFWSYLSKECP